MAAVYTPLPPTTNTLDPAQRLRLLKSTRKLGALLGTTPRIYVPEEPIPSPITPGTRAARREGRVFYNTPSASSSITSISSTELWTSPSSLSPPKQQHHHKAASTPIAIDFTFPGDGTTTTTITTTGSFGHKKSKSTHHNLNISPSQQPLLYSPMSSPSSSSLSSSPSSPPLSQPTLTKRRSVKAQSDMDRRRKMAKLARTLGENIPPELVFGPPPRSSSLAAASGPVSPSRRNRSVSGVHRFKQAVDSKDLLLSFSSPAPKSSIKRKPAPVVITGDLTKYPSSQQQPLICPSPIVTVTTTVTTQPTPATATATAITVKQRPRSLTLPAAISFARSTGIVFKSNEPKQEQPQQQRIGGSSFLDEPEYIDLRCEYTADNTDMVDFGKREEKEWNGQWNLKSLCDVQNGLRALRVRW